MSTQSQPPGDEPTQPDPVYYYEQPYVLGPEQPQPGQPDTTPTFHKAPRARQAAGRGPLGHLLVAAAVLGAAAAVGFALAQLKSADSLLGVVARHPTDAWWVVALVAAVMTFKLTRSTVARWVLPLAAVAVFLFVAANAGSAVPAVRPLGSLAQSAHGQAKHLTRAAVVSWVASDQERASQLGAWASQDLAGCLQDGRCDGQAIGRPITINNDYRVRLRHMAAPLDPRSRCVAGLAGLDRVLARGQRLLGQVVTAALDRDGDEVRALMQKAPELTQAGQDAQSSPDLVTCLPPSPRQ